MEDIIASTGDIKENYEVIGTTSAFFSTLVQKKPEKMTDIFDYLIKELMENASNSGGDGIIHIKVDKENFTSGYSIGSNILAYGTIIRLIK